MLRLHSGIVIELEFESESKTNVVFTSCPIISNKQPINKLLDQVSTVFLSFSNNQIYSAPTIYQERSRPLEYRSEQNGPSPYHGVHNLMIYLLPFDCIT